MLNELNVYLYTVRKYQYETGLNILLRSLGLLRNFCIFQKKKTLCFSSTVNRKGLSEISLSELNVYCPLKSCCIQRQNINLILYVIPWFVLSGKKTKREISVHQLNRRVLFHELMNNEQSLLFLEIYLWTFHLYTMKHTRQAIRMTAHSIISSQEMWSIAASIAASSMFSFAG